MEAYFIFCCIKRMEYDKVNAVVNNFSQEFTKFDSSETFLRN